MPATPPATPPTPRLAWNCWDQLEVPALGAWQPERRVSVVVPYYEAPEALRLTLAALAHQTYPRELLQVVVVDDGSTPPLQLPDDLDLDGLDVQVLHQEDRGFGAPRARNLGARTADGEVLVFLDCDMVPEPWFVEAHARWHHVAADLVVLGFRRHVEVDGLSARDVAGVDADQGLAPLFDGREVSIPEWIEGHMVRTDQLTTPDRDLFRPVASGNLSVRAEQYWRVGGFDEEHFTQWGGEDTELGFRLFVDGAVLVPDRDAMCWHQGEGHQPSPEEQASLDDQRALLAHLVADRGFRSSRPGRFFTMPRAVVRVPVATTTPREAVVATTESLLAGSFTDLLVVLEVADDHPSRTWLARQFAPDQKVLVRGAPTVEAHDGIADEVAPHAPIRGLVRPGAVAGPSAVAQLVAVLESTGDPVGVVTVELDGWDAPAMTWWLTRAERRVARAGTDDVLRGVADLFGSRRLAGDEVDVGDRPDVTDAPRTSVAAVGEAATLDEVAELWQLFRTLGPAERRVVVSGGRLAMRVIGPRTRRVLAWVVALVQRVAGLVRRGDRYG